MFNRFLVVIVVATQIATARGQNENDILIALVADEPQLLRTGSINTATGSITAPTRIYVETLTTLPGLDQAVGDEGFFAVSDGNDLPPGLVPLAATADVRFDFRALTIEGETANLWFWDTNASPGALDLRPVSDSRTVSLRKSPVAFFTATVDGGPNDVPGFVIDRTGGGGQLHKHLSILLQDADPNVALPPGLYVVGYTLSYGPQSELVLEILNADLGAAGQPFIDQLFAYLTDWLDDGPSLCLGDTNGDFVVDLSDLSGLLSNFGQTGATVAQGDFDGDGDVDLGDLSQLLAVFGTVCD